MQSLPRIEQLIAIAEEAGNIIMDYYQQQNFISETKEDKTPVTTADKEADAFICNSLQQLYPHIPVISEESPLFDYSLRQHWQEFFLVDPLDGTKEFLKHNGEFTVNIAYISPQIRLGVIYAPALEALFYADGKQSYKRCGEHGCVLRVVPEVDNMVVLVSRSHINQKTQQFIDQLDNPVLLPLGSSLKFCYLAESKATLYPRLGSINEWDIAAGTIILEQAGGEVRLLSGQPLVFNKPEMLVAPFCAYCGTR